MGLRPATDWARFRRGPVGLLEWACAVFGTDPGDAQRSASAREAELLMAARQRMGPEWSGQVASDEAAAMERLAARRRMTVREVLDLARALETRACPCRAEEAKPCP